LDVAALERGKVLLHCEPAAITPLLQDVANFFGPKAAEKSLKVSVEDTALPPVSMDVEKIRQVLTNLFSNAIKFTPPGGSIRLGAHLSNDFLRVSVRDSGVGISEADQLKIFNKFEQVKSARVQIKGPKGTGLGLSICKALVELHGGEIGIVSERGQGSEFFFLLPLKSPAPMAPKIGDVPVLKGN
jgi:signal transduction histidine kinase